MTMIRVILLAALMASMTALISACSVSGTGPYQTGSEAARNPLRAQELTLRAADLMGRDPQQAEKLLREALTADLYHGPAHNNLGVLFLKQGKLYEASEEFEWAKKLLPGHPDPRMNLALTLERAGRTDDALASYGSALEVYPNHVPTLQALTRLQIRASKTDDQTPDRLDVIALRGETPEWRQWAQAQLTKRR